MDFIIERLDFIMTFITTTGFTNLLMFIILIQLYRVVSIMEWSKVTLQEMCFCRFKLYNNHLPTPDICRDHFNLLKFIYEKTSTH